MARTHLRFPFDLLLFGGSARGWMASTLAILWVSVQVLGGSLPQVALSKPSNHRSNTLMPNVTLSPGQWLASSNDQFRFYLQGSDGNMVLRNQDGTAFWASNTSGKGGSRLILQGDANLVLYNQSDRVIWASDTAGSGANVLRLNDNGILALYKDTTEIKVLAPPQCSFSRSYSFNGNMSESVLRSYLSRSLTMSGFLSSDQYVMDAPIPFKDDDIRMILDLGAKFIGRAVFIWGPDRWGGDQNFYQTISQQIESIHQSDPDIIFQAAIFEIVTKEVNTIPIPDWVFNAFAIPVETRNFKYSAMLNVNGRYVNHWGDNQSVPDVSRLETRMWFYFLAKQYIDAGIEAFHWGQVELMAMAGNYNKYSGWRDLLSRVREYASTHARRYFVLNDGHVPSGGITIDGNLLLDFHSFPLRPVEIPREPQKAKLVKENRYAIYGRSKGGITPSGWSCSHLPYLVEFDNYGISNHPNQANSGTWTWGYDEISWFSLQPKSYRNEFLVYAHHWIFETDPAGYLEMPGNRKVVTGNGAWDKRYRANASAGNMTDLGYDQELTIKQLWGSEQRR